MFEEPQEVTWDKGSSGLVFYTDAQYWSSLKTDEERNCDDWDIDMSVYYKDNHPDLDSTQLKQMRDEINTKQGISNTKSVFKKRTPKTFIRNDLAINKSSKRDNPTVSKNNLSVPFPLFVKETGSDFVESSKTKTRKREKHEFLGNEFVQKVMKKHGWTKGQGLGAKSGGIKEAIDGEIDGQIHRAGFGYKK